MTELTRRALTGLLAGFGAAMLAPAIVPAAARANSGEPRGWRAGFSTAQDHLQGELTALSGRIPDGLEGVFYRVGPAQFDRDGERIGHWFDGDGMVQRFEIDGGRVRHHGRFVDTDKRRGEEAAGRFIYPGFGSSPRDAAAVSRPDTVNAANTSLLPMGDEVWALWEGGSPWRVNADTLDTIGRQAFDGALDGLPFSAHPKRGPDGDIWNFGAFGRQCVLWHLDPAGGVNRASVLELPVPSLMHDFAVTQSKIVLLLPPLLHTGERADTVIDAHRWRPEEPLRILVVAKADFSVTARYELPARYLFHIGNAFEEADGTIRLDTFLFADSSFATHSARTLVAGDYVPSDNAAPAMIALHPNGRADIATHDGSGEFPRTDPRLVGQRHRKLFGIVDHGVGAWDWESGRFSRHVYSADHRAEEPVFVPRSSRAGEGEGWLIATALNGAARRTELHIFDTRSVSDGPVASFACPYTLPLGFHGTFVGA